MQLPRFAALARYRLLQYVVSLALVAVSVAFTSVLWWLVDRPISAPAFLAAVVISTVIGGFRVGLFTSVISALAIDYYFIAPFHVLTGSQDEILRLFLFVSEEALLSWLVVKWRAAVDELSRSREALRELTRYQESVREEEQKRISREIHDELGQALTGLKLEIHLIKKRFETADRQERTVQLLSSLDDLSATVDSTIGTVRRISTEIRPSILDDFGLLAALEWQASEFEKKSGVKCTIRSDLDALSLDADARGAVFRIFQEALTNITRHADASRVNIQVSETGGNVSVKVEDNGRGIDLENVAMARTLGLIGMRERARLIGANISIEPRDEGGTRVELQVPVKREIALS